jgi:hypothetical protein
VINDQPGPLNLQLGTERKQSIPTMSYHHPSPLLINTAPSREEPLQAKPKHTTPVRKFVNILAPLLPVAIYTMQVAMLSKQGEGNLY